MVSSKLMKFFLTVVSDILVSACLTKSMAKFSAVLSGSITSLRTFRH